MRRRRPTATEKARRKDERMREVFKLANVTRWGEVRAAVLAGFDVNTSAPFGQCERPLWKGAHPPNQVGHGSFLYKGCDGSASFAAA